MKTDDLIAMLAAGVEPVPPTAVKRRFLLALSLGMAGALALMWVEYGVRPDIGVAVALPASYRGGPFVIDAADAAADQCCFGSVCFALSTRCCGSTS